MVCGVAVERDRGDGEAGGGVEGGEVGVWYVHRVEVREHVIYVSFGKKPIPNQEMNGSMVNAIHTSFESYSFSSGGSKQY